MGDCAIPTKWVLMVHLASKENAVEYEPILQPLVLLFIVTFTVWGLAGVVLSLRNKRSTLRAWWSGSVRPEFARLHAWSMSASERLGVK